MEKINLKPVNDNIIIKPTDLELVSGGGVIIPEGSQPEATSGTVVAVGPGAHRFAASTGNDRFTMESKVGDLVYYPKFGAHKLEYNDEDYVVIKEGDLFCRELKEDLVKEALTPSSEFSEKLKDAMEDSESLSEHEKKSGHK